MKEFFLFKSLLRNGCFVVKIKNRLLRLTVKQNGEINDTLETPG
jgi:hypothetical protein